MFRITIHQTGEEVVLTLEGVLAGACVGELEACWSNAMSSLGTRALHVDLRSVCHVDSRGRDVMARMHQHGVRFIAAGCEMPEVVRETAAPRPMFLERI